MSDIHLEFRKPAILGGEEFIIPVVGDVLVLAGDIDVGTNSCEWINSLGEQFKHVFYVLGNHEFYRNEWHDVQDAHKNFSYRENVHFMRYGTLPIEVEGYLFFGDTMWTDISDPLNALLLKNIMNDYRVIKIHDKAKGIYRKLSPEDTTVHHFKARSAIKEMVDNFPGYGKVMISHHLPHPQSIPHPYRSGKGEESNPAYMTDLTNLLADFDLWIHGHTHNSCDYKVGNTRIVCNPYGYFGHETNFEFSPIKTVDL